MRVGAAALRVVLSVPTGVTGLYAVSDDRGQSWPIRAWTTRWFGSALENPALRNALILSREAAAGATIVALVLGTLAALVVHLSVQNLVRPWKSHDRLCASGVNIAIGLQFSDPKRPVARKRRTGRGRERLAVTLLHEDADARLDRLCDPPLELASSTLDRAGHVARQNRASPFMERIVSGVMAQEICDVGRAQRHGNHRRARGRIEGQARFTLAVGDDLQHLTVRHFRHPKGEDVPPDRWDMFHKFRKVGGHAGQDQLHPAKAVGKVLDQFRHIAPERA